MQIQNFINNQFVPAQGGSVLDYYDPCTGRVLGQQPDSDKLDAVQAVAEAQKAFQQWRATSFAQRADVLSEIADLVLEERENLARAESQDVGKPYATALAGDIARGAENFKFFSGLIRTRVDTSYHGNNFLQYSLRQPAGVAALIAPWNYPFHLLTWKLAPALASGCTVVCKPSEVTPQSTYLLAKILQKSSLPAGVCNIIFGVGVKSGEHLVQHPSVKVVSFTGSTATGARVARLASVQMKKVSLELGGKNATLVFKDADQVKALPVVRNAAFKNSGQVCTAGSRLLVQQDIYDEFVGALKKDMGDIVVGAPDNEASFMGPLVSQAQLDKVQQALEQAKQEGGKIYVPEVLQRSFKQLPEGGYWFLPTLVEDLSRCSDLWQREIFGPILLVQSFKYPREAVEWANNTSYGLAGSVWTQNLKRAHMVAAQIDSGQVWVNSWGARDPRVPFGGMKQSGLGREGGLHSLDIYSEHKNVTLAL